MSKSLGKAPPELTAAIRKKCGETGHMFVAREVNGLTFGVCIKCGQIGDETVTHVLEDVNAKVLEWHAAKLEEAKLKLEEAQQMVYGMARLLARIRRQNPQMVAEAEATLHMTPRGAEWN